MIVGMEQAMGSGRGRIVPVLLSGGSGTRLWPLSRRSYPKQLLALAGEETLLQQTAARVGDGGRFAPPLVIGNAEHRFLIAEQLRAAGTAAQIVLEPEGRNTAPAAAVAALLALREDEEALVLLMPADHVIGRPAAFQAALEQGVAAARGGAFVLFGIRPSRPATGYGYIQAGAALAAAPGVHRVRRFVEKPEAKVAETYVAAGDHLWNSGIFLLPARKLLDELERFEGALVAACRDAVDFATHDLDFCRLDPAAFARAPSISLDYALMERTDAAAVVPVDCGWTDVGGWTALWEIAERDGAGNALIGEVAAAAASGCYVRSDGPLVAAVGVEDLVIVATADAVLVTRRGADEMLKPVVERLGREGKAAATQTRRCWRPWGFYESIQDGERFQVKRITVNPGAKLSLQKHFHRAEHWVVVNGTALVTRDDEQILLRENESIFLPLGCVHRLENPGKLPLNLIEVQSGAYLGEDDIVRIQDLYARA
jgi:mannose-1-phosphate guanylyltransferase/mannose-1-phosphate guanylyltransferase/mannose-6-phosphate isomerase